MNLSVAEEGKEYIIQRIETDDEELNAFLFSLGCYSGEPITVVSRRKGGCTVSIKDGRYNIDNQLAEASAVPTVKPAPANVPTAADAAMVQAINPNAIILPPL